MKLVDRDLFGEIANDRRDLCQRQAILAGQIAIDCRVGIYKLTLDHTRIDLTGRDIAPIGKVEQKAFGIPILQVVERRVGHAAISPSGP